MIPRNFFSRQIKFGSRDEVSHFVSRIVSRTQGVVGGVRGCRSSTARQPYNRDRKQEALGATLRSSYRINVSQVQRNFCAAHVNLGFTNFFLGAKARARHEQEFDERTTIWPCKSQKRDGTRVQNCCESASGWDEPIHFLFAL